MCRYLCIEYLECPLDVESLTDYEVDISQQTVYHQIKLTDGYLSHNDESLVSGTGCPNTDVAQRWTDRSAYMEMIYFEIRNNYFNPDDAEAGRCDGTVHVVADEICSGMHIYMITL